MVTNPDFDRNTGATISGWLAVNQSLTELFMTSFGDRGFREYYASGIPSFLGRNMTKDVLGRLATVLGAAIDVFEPRYRVKKITFSQLGPEGRPRMKVEGDYLPFALEGDFSTVEAKDFELPL